MAQINKKQILAGLGIYFAIRVFSYFFSPGTPLYLANPINWVVSLIILVVAIYLLFIKDERGWLIIAGELILGGAGSFLEIKGISLRTLLLACSLLIFVYQSIKNRSLGKFFENKTVLIVFIILLALVGVSAIRGYYAGHSLALIMADTIPYLFFLYYFPLKQLLQSDKFRQTSFNLLLSAIIGNAIFIYLTLAGFSAGIFVLQDSYYHWFRDVASGKITDYGTGFFRILTNEQLLIVPIFLWMFAKITRDENAKNIVVKISGALLLAVLTINITRIYLVALAVGVLFLFSRKNWKRWFAYSAAAFVFFILAFTLTHLGATKGKSLGWEYLGVRLQSIALPQTEDSSLSRLLLLPRIIEKIKLHPLLGNGLGDTVTVYSPIFKANVATPHFDWGYLEIWAEMGLLGMFAWLALIIYCLILNTEDKSALAPIVALLAINLTSPALFHVLGIILLTFTLAKTNPATRTGEKSILL